MNERFHQQKKNFLPILFYSSYQQHQFDILSSKIFISIHYSPHEFFMNNFISTVFLSFFLLKSYEKINLKVLTILFRLLFSRLSPAALEIKLMRRCSSLSSASKIQHSTQLLLAYMARE